MSTNKDTLDVTAVSMADVVAMCGDCARVCWQRTERVITNASRPPAGVESIHRAAAEERRREDYAMCMSSCELVPHACPPEAVLRRHEAALERRDAGDKTAATSASLLTAQAASRCEHAIERFTATLFALAHKPSKVAFAYGNIVSEDAPATPRAGGAPTAVHEKVLRGGPAAAASGEAAMDDEIMRRWSAARRGRQEMEQRGLLRSAAGVAELRQQQQQQPPPQEQQQQPATTDSDGARATTPRW